MASIRKQFFNPKLSGSFSGAATFLKNRKFKDKNEVIKELNSLNTYTLHKPVREKFKRRRVFVPFIDWQWCADLVDMQKYSKVNRGFRYILTVIDSFSKFLFTIPLKDKKGLTLKRAFTKILRTSKRKCKFLWIDMGSEFLNAHTKAFFKKEGIVIFHTYSKLKVTIVERLIRTLRSRIERYFTYTGKEKWIDVLPQITQSYNSTYHSSIKTAPRLVNSKNEHEIWLNLYTDMVLAPVSIPKFKVKDLVRISRQKATFEKGYKQNWSTEVFRILKVQNTNPPTYLLEDLHNEPVTGGFYEQEIQLYAVPPGERT